MSILDGNSPVQPVQQVGTPQPAAAPVQQVQPDPLAPQPANGLAGQAGGGFLNDLGVDWGGVSTSNAPSDGTHHGYLTKAEVRTKKDTTKSLVLTYRVADGENEQGKTIDEWKSLPITVQGPTGPRFATEDDERNARFLKQRLISLGVPEDRINTLNPGDLQGTEVYFTVKSKGEYTNVTFVKLAAEVNASPLMAGNTAPAQAPTQAPVNLI